MVQTLLGVFRFEPFLNLLPDIIAGVLGRLKQETGLVGDVLEIANQAEQLSQVFR